MTERRAASLSGPLASEQAALDLWLCVAADEVDVTHLVCAGNGSTALSDHRHWLNSFDRTWLCMLGPRQPARARC